MHARQGSNYAFDVNALPYVFDISDAQQECAAQRSVSSAQWQRQLLVTRRTRLSACSHSLIYIICFVHFAPSANHTPGPAHLWASFITFDTAAQALPNSPPSLRPLANPRSIGVQNRSQNIRNRSSGVSYISPSSSRRCPNRLRYA